MRSQNPSQHQAPQPRRVRLVQSARAQRDRGAGIGRVRRDDADLVQRHRTQLARALIRPGFGVGGEADAHAAQIAALCQRAHVAAERGVGQVEDEFKAGAGLVQAQRAGSGAGQQAGGIMVGQCEDVGTARERRGERAGFDGFAEQAIDVRRSVERRGGAIQRPPGRADFGDGAVLEGRRHFAQGPV
jgi:hypothetical protein